MNCLVVDTNGLLNIVQLAKTFLSKKNASLCLTNPDKKKFCRKPTSAVRNAHSSCLRPPFIFEGQKKNLLHEKHITIKKKLQKASPKPVKTGMDNKGGCHRASSIIGAINYQHVAGRFFCFVTRCSSCRADLTRTGRS